MERGEPTPRQYDKFMAALDRAAHRPKRKKAKAKKKAAPRRAGLRPLAQRLKARKTESEYYRNPRTLEQAKRLYKGFTGTEPRTLKRITVPPLPTHALAIGKVLGIIYSVDATGEKFKHAFAASARPLLIVSADGRQVFISGGEYTFTSRGFVDKPRRR